MSTDPATKIERDAATYRAAAQHNRDEPFLRGSTIVLPNYGQLVVTGDLHGHRRNLQRIMNFCDLHHAPARHVVLHEIIHEEPEGIDGQDMSHEVLLDAAKWKTAYPEQIHFLQSNHELAQLIEQDITKGGRVVTYSFLAGMRETYGESYTAVADALLEFIASYPLAIRTANRVMISHSLPGPEMMKSFDPTVLDREPTGRDLGDGGSGYMLVWGRHQTKKQLDDLSEELNVNTFICGHQPQDMGYDVVANRLIIVASDHNHGVLLPFDLKKQYTTDDLVEAIRPLASIV